MPNTNIVNHHDRYRQFELNTGFAEKKNYQRGFLHGSSPLYVSDKKIVKINKIVISCLTNTACAESIILSSYVSVLQVSLYLKHTLFKIFDLFENNWSQKSNEDKICLYD